MVDVDFSEVFYLTDTGRRWDGGSVSVRDRVESGFSWLRVALSPAKVMVWVCSWVPAIFIDNTGRGYTRQLEKEHGLVFNFSEDDGDVERALDKAAWLLGRDDLR